MAATLIYAMIKSISIAFLYRSRYQTHGNLAGFVLDCVASADKTARRELATCHLSVLFLVLFFYVATRKLFPLPSSTTQRAKLGNNKCDLQTPRRMCVRNSFTQCAYALCARWRSYASYTSSHLAQLSAFFRVCVF